jgi:hypothetical protein
MLFNTNLPPMHLSRCAYYAFLCSVEVLVGGANKCAQAKAWLHPRRLSGPSRHWDPGKVQ